MYKNSTVLVKMLFKTPKQRKKTCKYSFFLMITLRKKSKVNCVFLLWISLKLPLADTS